MDILQSATTKLGNKIDLIGKPENDNVLVIGVFHGDEPQGKYLIEKYLALPPLPNPLPQGARGQYSLQNLQPDDTQYQSVHSSPLQTGVHQGMREYLQQQYSSFSKIKSKELSKTMTDAELILWYYLRAKRLYGLKFKRQQPIGNYVVDFVNFENRLVIEVDGGHHNEIENINYDAERTQFLETNGFKVIRFWNNEIFENIESCLECILNNISLPTARGRVRERGGLFIPCLNPDGLSLNQRTNANNVDLNRNFPTKNWGEDGSSAGDNPDAYYGGEFPASEIETKFIIEVIEKYSPKLILTLHAPYKIVNYDGPAAEVAKKISDIIKYPVEAGIGYPTPGSFGTYCGVERNIPTITLELDEKIPVAQLEQPVFEIFDMLTTRY